HPRHRAGPNALDGLLASEETQYRRRVKEKMALGHFRPEGIGEHGSIPGEPGVDYPTYSKPPVPSFSCLDFKGRRGYVADPSTRCQVRRRTTLRLERSLNALIRKPRLLEL
ncbi:Uncharacterized protein GBIM_06970, partial [Gryllus bimaculatus]